MEIQLQELIEQIKKDGVDAAEAKAADILAAAKAEAEKIVADAKAQADRMIADAKNENAKTVKSGEDAIRQAGRNLLISFRESVTRELKAIVSDNVNAVYSSDAFAKLEEAVLAELKAKMLGGVTLKANDNFDGGFRIAVNNGAVYYDYSAEAVTDMLSNYLSPRVIALLKEAE